MSKKTFLCSVCLLVVALSLVLGYVGVLPVNPCPVFNSHEIVLKHVVSPIPALLPTPYVSRHFTITRNNGQHDLNTPQTNSLFATETRDSILLSLSPSKDFLTPPPDAYSSNTTNPDAGSDPSTSINNTLPAAGPNRR